MMETPQNHPHHCHTVGEHTISAVANIRADRVLRLSMLFHDIAKPKCRTTDENGTDHFRGHQQAGSEMTRQILRRLKFDNDTTDRVCRLVRWHDDRPELSEKSVRRAVSRIGLGQYPALFEVKRADILAQSDYMRPEKLAYVDAYERIYCEIRERQQCLCLKDLAVTGRDLIESAGMKPGPGLGAVLEELLEAVLEEPEKNTRETLLALAKKS